MKFNSEQEFDDFVVNLMVKCGGAGVEAAVGGFRTYFETKGLFDNGSVRRWEFEMVADLIGRQFIKSVEDAIRNGLKEGEK